MPYKLSKLHYTDQYLNQQPDQLFNIIGAQHKLQCPPKYKHQNLYKHQHKLHKHSRLAD